MKYFYLLLISATLFTACKEAKPTEETVSATIKVNVDTILNTKPEQKVTDSMISGAFRGIFPCSDCKGIQQTIFFKKDHTFLQEQMKWGKNAKAKDNSGKWIITNGIIKLIQNDENGVSFRYSNDSLFAIKINGIPLEDSIKYSLAKRRTANDNPVWMKKKSKGVLFTGIGTEPFWNLEMKNEKMYFKMADWQSPIVAAIDERKKNNDTIIYTLASNKRQWKVSILPEICSDGMSDFIYQYKVMVYYDGKDYQGCGINLSELE